MSWRPTLLCFALLAAPGRADAAMMFHHDLASLAYLSDGVVRAERLDPHGTNPTRYRVTEVLAGGWAVGDVVAVPTSLYALGFMTPGFTPGTDTVLFLVRHPERGVFLAPSGLRVLDPQGHAHRFVQMSNPGPYAAVPQGPDPVDVRRDTEPHPPVDMARLLAMTRAGIRRAEAVRAALALTDPAARRAALVPLFGPAPRAPLIDDPPTHFYLDAMADRVVAQLAADGDPIGALEVWSRMVGWRSRARALARDPAVAAVAFDAAAPVRLRAAALGAAFGLGHLPTDDEGDRLVALLAHDDARMRVAALGALDYPARVQSTAPGWPARQRRLRRSVSVALAARWPREGDAVVRVHMLRAAEVWSVRPRGLGRFAFAAEREGGDVRYLWARRRSGAPPAVTIDGCAADPTRATGWHGATRGGGRITPSACAGVWEVVARTRGGVELARVRLAP